MESPVEISKRREIADRLKTIRTAKGITQEKMAELLEVSYNTYVKIENAQHGLTLKNLMKIRDIFSVKTDVILYGDAGDITFQDYITIVKMLNEQSLENLQRDIQKILKFKTTKAN